MMASERVNDMADALKNEDSWYRFRYVLRSVACWSLVFLY